MGNTENDELGFDSALSPDVVELLTETKKTGEAEKSQNLAAYLDEHEQALTR